MQILSLYLKNIKSYGADGATIPFGPGLNLIKGNNGAGKSTVLEAIGYALFDSEPYSPMQNFVREGQKNGEIVVTVLSSVDDREYQVVRGVGKSSYYVYDRELKTKVTSAASDTRDWLIEHLGIDPDIDLKALFRDAVGVPQGTMTAIFLETPGPRQKKFDILLQVEEYKTAFENLRTAVHYVDGLKSRNNDERLPLSGELKRLPKLSADIDGIESGLKRNRAKVKTLNEQLDAFQAMLDHMDAQHQAIDDLNEQIVSQKSTLAVVHARLEQAILAVDESRVAAQIMQQTVEAQEQYDLAGQELQQLETFRKERDRWKTERADITGTRIREQTQLDQIHQRLQDIAQAEKEMIRLEPLANRQDELETALQEARIELQRYLQLTESIASDQIRLVRLQGDLERLQDEVNRRAEIDEQIEKKKRERDTLHDEIERITSEIVPLDKECIRLKTALDDQKKRDEARQRILKRIDDIDRALQEQRGKWDAIQSDFARRLELQKDLESLEEQQTAVQKRDLEAQATIDRADRQLQEIESFRQITDAAETVCPICQRPLDAEARDNSLAHYADEFQRVEAQRTEAEAVLLESKHTQKNLAKSIKTARTELNRLANDTAAALVQGEMARYESDSQTQLQELADVSDAPEQIAQLIGDLETAAVQIHKFNVQKQAFETDYRVCVAAIETDQQKLSELARPVELEQKQHEHTALADEIAENRKLAAVVANSERRCRELEMSLDELGNPKWDYKKASDMADTRMQSEYERDVHQAKIDDLDRQIGEYDQALAEYDSLDQAMETAHQRQKSNRAGHEQYVQNSPLAEQLADRETRQGQLEGEHTRLRQALDELEQQHKEHLADYDAQHHEEIRQSHQKQRDIVNQLSGEIANAQLRLDELLSERTGLVDLQTRYEELEAEADRLQEENAALEFVRNTIRDAGPYITEQLIGLIAAEANQIFGEIIGDYSLTLDWQKDYSIVITQHGKVDEPREFKLLSGGEQMAAALSVRLALLSRLSNIRFAFFDEPTSNLDGIRRIQLAQRLNAIRSLRQVFVISHDDTFEEASQHVIHIQKTDDMSQVEVL